jgi:hypothetical protein
LTTDVRFATEVMQKTRVTESIRSSVERLALDEPVSDRV